MSDSISRRELKDINRFHDRMAAGERTFDRDDVRELLNILHRERYRFEMLAFEMAEQIRGTRKPSSDWSRFVKFAGALAIELDGHGIRDEIERVDFEEANDGC